MKLYGAHPKDTCPWGCCGELAPAWKHTKAARAARKVAKKRARREGPRPRRSLRARGEVPN